MAWQTAGRLRHRQHLDRDSEPGQPRCHRAVLAKDDVELDLLPQRWQQIKQRELATGETGAMVQDNHAKPTASGGVDGLAVDLERAFGGAVPGEGLLVIF